ncbi:unnamed protein product [Rhizophagus irregularis]|nr:unnamed protein product [Rhizophagus irregularis]
MNETTRDDIKKTNDLIQYNIVNVNTDLTIAPVSDIRSITVWAGNSDERYDYFNRITYNRDKIYKILEYFLINILCFGF